MRNIIKIIFILFVWITSCKSKVNSDSENKIEIDQKKLNINSNLSIKDSININNFLEKIEKEKFSKLPVEKSKFFFLEKNSHNLPNYEDEIINDFANRDKLLSLKTSLVNTDFLKKINPYNHTESIKIDEVFFDKKIRINDSISCFTAIGFKSFSGVIYPKFIFTYNNRKKAIIDNEIINLFCSVDLWNIHTGTYISEKNEIKMVMHSGFETEKGVVERKLKIQDNGKIELVDIKSYGIDTEKEFHDYQNDFEELKIEPITKEEKAQLFKNFTSTVTNLTLPYNSKEFYNLMQIDSPEKGKSIVTNLRHEQLQWNENVKYFFSKDPNTVAFKPKRKDYDQGYYFYPIGIFPVNENNVGILYLYQSFCNYHPTVYVQLNTYDPQGNILDTQILDRRFYSGMYRFLSSIEIQENLQIDIKQFIQSYEDQSENEELEKPEIKETSFQITPEGLIK